MDGYSSMDGFFNGFMLDFLLFSTFLIVLGNENYIAFQSVNI